MKPKLPLWCAVLGLGLLIPMVRATASAGPAEASSGSKTATKAAAPKAAASSGKTDATPSEVATTPRGPALFKLLDTDKNGRVSAAEFIAYGKARDAAPDAGKAPGSPADKGKSVAGTDTKDAPKNATKRVDADKQSAAAPQPSLPDTGILTSTSTRAGKYTAEVFEILDINHDKFLDQKELDALTGAHQISQP